MVVKVKLFEVSNRLRGRDRKVLKINEDTGQILITVNKQAAGRQWCSGVTMCSHQTAASTPLPARSLAEAGSRDTGGGL